MCLRSTIDRTVSQFPAGGLRDNPTNHSLQDVFALVLGATFCGLLAPGALARHCVARRFEYNQYDEAQLSWAFRDPGYVKALLCAVVCCEELLVDCSWHSLVTISKM
jgi:hypothetical protein